MPLSAWVISRYLPEGIDLDDDLRSTLEEATRRRNILAHEFFLTHVGTMTDIPEHERVKERLQDDTHFFQKAFGDIESLIPAVLAANAPEIDSEDLHVLGEVLKRASKENPAIARGLSLWSEKGLVELVQRLEDHFQDRMPDITRDDDHEDVSS